MRRLITLMTMVGIILTVSPAFAFNASNKLCWIPNTEGDLVGYRLMLTPLGGVPILRDITISDANSAAPCLTGETGITLGSLAILDGNYTAVITAYDSNGNESVPSLEVVPSPFLLDATRPAAPSGFSVR